MTPEERNVLFDDLIEGSISEADLLRIEAELIIDAEVRQAYYQRVQLHWLIEQAAKESEFQADLFNTNDSQLANSKTKQVRPSQKRAWPVWAVATSLTALAASILLLILSPNFGSNDTEDVSQSLSPGVGESETEASEFGFAILRGQSNSIWKNQELKEGDLLPTGPLELLAGQIHVELFSGVQLVIKGEAEFSIDSAMLVTMAKGQARALVPEPAQGFRIRTATGEIVDLGTEFCIDVGAEQTDVEVIAGEVELELPDSTVHALLPDSSTRLTRAGAINMSEGIVPRLVAPDDFQAQLRQKQSERFKAWQQSVQAWCEDPRLLAYYDFEADSKASRFVDNRAKESLHLASQGAIVGGGRTENRWGLEQGAVDLTRLGSRVRVNVPGEHRGLTFVCWTKIDSLPHLYNSLFLTDGHDDREPHWQIMHDGRIFFSVKIPASKGGQDASELQHEFYSPSIWNPTISGRWIMLAVTYDIEQKQVTHFLNGEPLSREPITEKTQVDRIRIGNGSIGNWSQPMYRTDPEFVLRNLNGSVDDFMIFSAALSSDELKDLYRTGETQ